MGQTPRKNSGLATDFATEFLLTQSFKEHERHTIGQIERTRLRVEHGNSQPRIGMIFEKFFGQPGSFTAEDEIILRSEVSFRVKTRSAGFNKPEPRVLRKRFGEFAPVRPALPLHMLPII